MTDSKQRPDTAQHRFGPFITWISETRANRTSLLLTSRRVRKGLAPLEVPSGSNMDPTVAVRGIKHSWLHLWAPLVLGWWVGVLFMIGSALFAIGGAMGVWPEMPGIRSIDKSHLGWIFFVGSLFFTSAGYLQWFEVINGDVTSTETTGSVQRRWLFYGWRPRNLGYLAVAAQLIGTLFFNISTADAFITGLNQVDENILVWTPNMIGSVCFLVASHAAVTEVSHRYWTWQFHNLSWWITAFNMLGSIFFMASAFGSFVEPNHILASLWVADFGTFAGAVCFFVGGYLLIPEQFENKRSPSATVVEPS
ncbi:MAG: hypothetical protein V7700_12690 [Halioglobus sp.]